MPKYKEDFDDKYWRLFREVVLLHEQWRQHTLFFDEPEYVNSKHNGVDYPEGNFRDLWAKSLQIRNIHNQMLDMLHRYHDGKPGVNKIK
jgi:hypothetical protein